MVDVLKIDSGFEAALKALRDGGIVAVPTETVYGLAADATNEEAVARIYSAKGRPSFNPLIAHVSSAEMAADHASIDEMSRKLMDYFWPGPLTLVLPLKTSSPICAAVKAGLDTIALRQPEGMMAELAATLGAPIAAPSANSSGRISPTTAQHVADDLGSKVDLILDGGPCTVGVESTIIRCMEDGVHILRAGGVTSEAIERVTAPLIHPSKAPADEIRAPGMLLAHYAPTKPLRLNASSVREGEALLCFGQCNMESATIALNLSPKGHMAEAAQNLFAMLTELDRSAAASIAVQPIPSHGLGAAINDRLRRAVHGSHDTREGGNNDV